MPKLLLATNNTGKVREIQAMLDEIDVTLVTPKALALRIEVEEDGVTYAENAAKKARIFANASGLMTLADDSGLEVEALAGAPGLFSARYAPQPGATDADRRAYLLRQLQGLPHPWRARFQCTVALATVTGEMYFAEGSCLGEIIPQERGRSGFGYDPIFLIAELGRTMAELTMEEKNRVSHRAGAVKAVKPILLSLL